MLSLELKSKILQVVDTTMTIEEFEDWLVPELPVYLASPNSVDADVVAAVELGLAEMSDGIITKNEFLTLLKNIIREQETILDFHFSTSPESNVRKSSNQTSQRTLDFTTPVAIPS